MLENMLKRVTFPPLNTSRPSKYSCFFHKRSTILKTTKNNREEEERDRDTERQGEGKRYREGDRDSKTEGGLIEYSPGVQCGHCLLDSDSQVPHLYICLQKGSKINRKSCPQRSGQPTFPLRVRGSTDFKIVMKLQS